MRIAWLVLLGWLLTAGSAQAQKVEWTHPDPAVTGFNVERALDLTPLPGTCVQPGPFTKISTVGRVFLFVDPGPLIVGTRYCYRVNAFNARGAGPYSASGKWTHAVAGPPAAPVLLPVTTIAPAPGLKASYAMSEGVGSAVADTSGNGNVGTLAGGTTWTTAGKFGNALAFSGLAHVSVPHSASLTLGATGTVSAWVNLAALGRWHTVVAKVEGTSNRWEDANYALSVSSGNRVICALGNRTASARVTSTVALTSGRFYHLSCVWTGSALVLGIDGVPQGSVPLTFAPTANASPLLIGQWAGGIDRLSGVIDEVRIYNRTLTQAEIQADMAGPVPPCQCR